MPTADTVESTGGPASQDAPQYKHLSAYAQFLLDHRLEAFSGALLTISRELNIPLLRYFESLPDEQLIAIGMEGNRKLLEAFAHNNIAAYIADNLRSWKENQLPLIQGDDVVIEDISKVNFSRRKAFRDFLPQYSTDTLTYISIMEEIDSFTLTQEEQLYKTLFEMKEQKILAHTAELEHREQQLREAQEIGGMGSFDWDLSGSHQSRYSPQLIQIFELEEPSGNLADFMQYIHPSDRPAVTEALTTAIKDGQMYECEYRYRKTGPEKVLWSRGMPVFEDGQVVKLRGTVMDITLRHDMLKRLERSEQLHKQAQALTHLGNWSWSLADNKVEWSDEMYRIFGLAPQSEMMTLGRILSMLHPDDRAPRHAALHHAINTLETEDYTMRVLLEDGTMKFVEGKTEVLTDESGKPYKLAGTNQDITKQHLLLDLLRENEEASSQLINNAPGAIVVIDESSTILLWNPMAETTFGWTADEIRGKKVVDTIIPPVYRESHLSGMQRLLTTGKSRVLNQTVEITALKKTGEEFYISMTTSRSQRGGKPVFIAFIRDISNEKAAERKLVEQRNQLAQKARELERSNQELMAFNYIASHDLQEPVRKIKIFSNLIMGNHAEPLPERTRASVERIATAAAHMHRLIEALIAFSRTSTGDRTFEPVDLNEIVADVTSILREIIEEQGVVITASPLPRLNAIPFQIQQLFENVISNAIKYRNPGVAPQISISAEIVSGSTIAAPGADPTIEYYRISVADNGIGFEQQYAGKVFELFQRLHNKHEYSGTGIGLAICKKIVQHHDGFITATSSVGQGTTFHIYLPRSTDQ